MRAKPGYLSLEPGERQGQAARGDGEAGGAAGRPAGGERAGGEHQQETVARGETVT